MNFLAGQVLAFDKPYGITSFALVNKVRWLLTQRMGGKKIKVGHAGTLDPLATGVMVVCTGRATKSIDSLQAGVKEHVAARQVGATTPRYDLEQPIDATYPTVHSTRALIDETLPRFVGEIMQVPPAFSACKVEGKRAYDLARRGEDVALRAKPLRIDEMEVVGQALQSGAHLTALRRTQVGNYRVAECHTIESFEQWLQTIEIETDL